MHGYSDREHTEWQWPISGVHSLMMEKSALADENGGCTPTPFHSSYHHVQSCSIQWYTPASRQIRSSYFISTSYVLCGYSFHLHNATAVQLVTKLLTYYYVAHCYPDNLFTNLC